MKNKKPPNKSAARSVYYYVMRQDIVKNICWGFLGGFVVFIYFVAVGIIYGISIIGAKKAWMCFKFAVFTLAPFGKNVSVNYGLHKFGNTFWIITTGWQICAFCSLLSLIWTITYFGRYLGARWFHLAQFVISPFGATIKKTTLLTGSESAIASIRGDDDFDLAK